MDSPSDFDSLKGGALGLPGRMRLAMFFLNFYPPLHIVAMLLIAVANLPAWERITGVLGVLLILPPLLVRLMYAVSPPPNGRIPAASTGFLVWWAALQIQVIFNRLPMIEETMRMFPGLYSAWIRLWGSHIGKTTFWSPGLIILDRQNLDLGDEVLFGGAVRLVSHVVMRNQVGRVELAIAPIKLGSRCFVGGSSTLTAGTEIAPGEFTRAHLLSMPFTLWRDGRPTSVTPKFSSSASA